MSVWDFGMTGTGKLSNSNWWMWPKMLNPIMDWNSNVPFPNNSFLTRRTRMCNIVFQQAKLVFVKVETGWITRFLHFPFATQNWSKISWRGLAHLGFSLKLVYCIQLELTRIGLRRFERFELSWRPVFEQRPQSLTEVGQGPSAHFK